MYIAHFDHRVKRKPHYLSEHVSEMFKLIDSFQLDFDLYNMTKAGVVIHDVGKKSIRFQEYVQDPEGKRGSIRHALGGAYLLVKKKPEVNEKLNYLVEFLANIVAGHHVGLYNHNKGFFEKVIDQLPNELHQIEYLAEEEMKKVMGLLDESPIDAMFETAGDKFPLYVSMLVRFVMSGLVDADYLSTESYFSKEKGKMRLYQPLSFGEFQATLKQYLVKEFSHQEMSLLNEVKQQVQVASLQAGRKTHSFFTLHAPTGTGKTLASLCFAIEHAKLHKKRRVIAALPLTNLTEEVGSIYKSIFGTTHVIEDHSNIALLDKNDGPTRLAAENWDRSFVVTTTVQLFESLFHYRPMKLRKLHRLANSIIILDEYHKLPLDLLEPILQHLDILQTYFNVTVLFMSATPFPLLTSKKLNAMSLCNKPLEIIDYDQLYRKVPHRVTYEWEDQPLALVELAERIANESAVLTIVNTRKEAQKLHKLLIEMDHSFEAVYYLTTTMCGAHRDQVIKEIKCKRNPKSPRNIAVISTQILEAGIDVDFPNVYRMIAPLDSIVQAAGRCNRYGKLPHGRVVIFQMDNPMPVDSSYEAGIALSLGLLKEKGIARFMEPDSFISYYSSLFTGRDLNQIDLTPKTCFEFRDKSQAFRMIQDSRISVIYTQFDGFKEEWLQENKTAAWWRKIQPYTISVSISSSDYEEINGFNIWRGAYHHTYGLLL